MDVLLKNKRVVAFLRTAGRLKDLITGLAPHQMQMILALPVMQQGHTLATLPKGQPLPEPRHCALHAVDLIGNGTWTLVPPSKPHKI